jgi:putative ABC transport system substrate-binding protein
MQTRRTLLTRLTQVGLLSAGLGLAASCDRLPGQAARVPRVGFVANLSPPGDTDTSANTQALIAGMGDYGYDVGQNLILDSRFPSDASQNAEMISDVLRSGVVMLVTGGTAAAVTAKQATSTVPIVGISVTDPVGQGLVQSLARPGRNVTGISLDGTEYVGKWLELLLKIKPTLRRVGWLYNPDNPGHIANLERASALAAASGLEIVPAEARVMADLDSAFEKVVTSGAGALIAGGYGGADGTARLAALALSHHLISLGVSSSNAAEGLLLSYSPNYIAMWRRAAYFVNRILKGAKPADLPMELPTTFDLIVNHATAAALGVTIPDEVTQQVTSWV